MRRVVMTVSMVAGLFVGLQGCAAETARSLEGAWELVEAKQTPPDFPFTFAEWRQIKILTKTHWAYLSQKREPSNRADATRPSERLERVVRLGLAGELLVAVPPDPGLEPTARVDKGV